MTRIIEFPSAPERKRWKAAENTVEGGSGNEPRRWPSGGVLGQRAGQSEKVLERYESLERQVKDLTGTVENLTEELRRTNRRMLIVMERIAVEQMQREERKEKKEHRKKVKALEEELTGLQEQLHKKRRKL